MSSRSVVGVDVRRATLWPETGIGRYSRSLTKRMLASRPPDLEIRPIDVRGSDRWDHRFEVGAGRPARRRLLQEQIRMAALSRRLSLLHLPWHEGPIRPACPLIVTVFDLATINGASGYDLAFRAYYNSLLRAHMRVASTIIVASETSLDAIRTQWPRQRYRCIPLGVDPVFTFDPTVPRTEYPTILYSGGYDPRKRVGDLIAAVGTLRRSDPDVRLVLTGRPPQFVLNLARRVLGDAVTLTGFLEDAELAAAYRRAWVVAYPTDLEGFGFPIVEAFASGTPLVATAGGSVAEIAGSAALLALPGDIEQLASLLDVALYDGAERERLTRGGLVQAKRYDWARVAAETLDVYREVLG